MKRGLFILLLPLAPVVLAAQTQATLVSADTGGVFWHRGQDSLRVSNQTWVGRDSASALPDCVYSASNPRMMGRDSMEVTIRNRDRTWHRVLHPGDEVAVNWSTPVTFGRFTLVDVSAPRSPCGVNAGQIWYHWTVELSPVLTP